MANFSDLHNASLRELLLDQYVQTSLSVDLSRVRSYRWISTDVRLFVRQAEDSQRCSYLEVGFWGYRRYSPVASAGNIVFYNEDYDADKAGLVDSGAPPLAGQGVSSMTDGISVPDSR
jgi:hypothetical protein